MKEEHEERGKFEDGWRAAVVYGTLLIGMVFNMWYATHIDSVRAEHDAAQSAKFKEYQCSLVKSQIDSDRREPATTIAGRDRAESWVRIYHQFGC